MNANPPTSKPSGFVTIADWSKLGWSFGWISLGLTLCLTLFYEEDIGNGLIRNTIRVALAWYLVALLLMLRFNRSDRDASTTLGRSGRIAWTWSLLFYLIHVVCAFHFYHGWSHAHAIEHTLQVSGFGPGIYMSHLFSLLWSLDVAYWWYAPQQRAVRRKWIPVCLYLFMLFIVFNGTVVFESGFARWFGIGMFLMLFVAALRLGLQK